VSGARTPQVEVQTSSGRQGVPQPQNSSVPQRRGIGYTLPRRSNETRTGLFNQAVYKEHDYIERTIHRLKQFRRVATRYEKRAVNLLAMVTLATIMLWL
jgi:transposase